MRGIELTPLIGSVPIGERFIHWKRPREQPGPDDPEIA
jgi:hypothetical protein